LVLVVAVNKDSKAVAQRLKLKSAPNIQQQSESVLLIALWQKAQQAVGLVRALADHAIVTVSSG
jgi:hypothetical protein